MIVDPLTTIFRIDNVGIVNGNIYEIEYSHCGIPSIGHNIPLVNNIPIQKPVAINCDKTYESDIVDIDMPKYK